VNTIAVRLPAVVEHLERVPIKDQNDGADLQRRILIEGTQTTIAE
jgi:hypothetical protein